MTAYLYGEMTADAQRIILLAESDAWDTSTQLSELGAAAALQQLTTPLYKPTDPAGAQYLPLTWPAVVQLSATYGQAWKPGPALAEWIAQQITARTSEDDELTVAPPPGLVPRSYQVAAARMIGRLGSALLFDDPGPQPVDTPIFTPDGWTTLGALQPGDVVFNLYGEPTPVRAVKHFGKQLVYRVTLNDRTSTFATGEHRWRVYTFNDRKRDNGGRVLSTDQLREIGLHFQNGNTVGARYYLPQQPVIDLPGRGFPELSPYAYGALLGDGSLGGEHMSIACPDDYVIDKVVRSTRRLGTSGKRNRPDDRCQNYVFHRTGKLRATLNELGALVPAGDKHIHPQYLTAHIGARRGLLAGLLDTDGTTIRTGAGVEFSSASPRLAADVAWLARSLGAVVTESDPQPPGYRNGDGERVECQPKHRVLMRFPADGPNPFELPRKAEVWAAAAAKVQRRRPPRTIQSIEPEGHVEVCCIELDTDDDTARVYLTDTTLIPTHNTGKTISTILGLLERDAAGHPVLPVVVVCPNAVQDSWVEHFHRWAPRWRVRAWRGTPQQRIRMRGTADVYVSSYGTARMDAQDTNVKNNHNPLLAIGGATVIADEVHKLKTQASEQSRAVRRLAAKARNFIGLSGTPITHHPGDLWPALAAMEPGAYPSRERWVGRYCTTVQGAYTQTVLGLDDNREPEFRLTLLGQYRRVAKADVLTELPPKVYSVRHVEIPAEYRKAYDAMEADMLAELPGDEDGPGGELTAMTVLAQMTRLLQLASAAADVKVTYETVEDPEIPGLTVERPHTEVKLKAPSWKVDALLEVLAERPDQQVIACAPSRQLMMLAGAQAKAKGYRVGYVVGGQSAKERTAAIDAFQAGELDLICVTTQAGGVGITLTAASTVVFLQRPWSLVDSLQMEDRAHRIGSERHESIEVIDILAKNTIETRVRSVLKDRADQLSRLVEDPRIVRELLGGDNVKHIRKKAAA